jgi:CRISPR/Cas system-associated exonuclease Cas4 (RecB family)
MIERWSFSRLSTYEQCPKRAQLAYAEYLPEIRRPDGNKAADRGTRIHDLSEKYVKREIDTMAPEMMNFEKEFDHARAVPRENLVAEHKWYFDRDWNPTTNPDDRWLTVIIDLLIWINQTESVCVDYKTGKRYGNEIKHGQQIQLYQLATLVRFPETEFISTEVWYLDQDEIAQQQYSRDQGMRFMKGFDKRGKKMTNDVKFEAKPSQYSCRFCPYRTGANKWVCGTGDCTLNPPDNTEIPAKEYQVLLSKLEKTITNKK